MDDYDADEILVKNLLISEKNLSTENINKEQLAVIDK